VEDAVEDNVEDAVEDTTVKDNDEPMHGNDIGFQIESVDKPRADAWK
jgi:hypothetical protein